MKKSSTKMEGLTRQFLEDKSSATLIHSMVNRQTVNSGEDEQGNTAGDLNSKMITKKAS